MVHQGEGLRVSQAKDGIVEACHPGNDHRRPYALDGEEAGTIDGEQVHGLERLAHLFGNDNSLPSHSAQLHFLSGHCRIVGIDAQPLALYQLDLLLRELNGLTGTVAEQENGCALWCQEEGR